MDQESRDKDQADELLAVRCQLGERAAFDELAQRWAMPLKRYAMRLSGDAHSADDMTQEIWLAVLQGMARLRDPANLRSWLFAIAHRVLMDRLRTQYAGSDNHAGDSRDEVAVDFDGDRALDRQQVNRGLDLLPVAEREVLILFYFQELSIHEVASALCLPVGTIKSRLFRARGLLRARLSQKESAA